MPKVEAPEFQWFVWTVFAIENWVLDFGRPIAMVRFKKSPIFEIDQKSSPFLFTFC